MPYRLPTEGDSRGTIGLIHGIHSTLRSKAAIGTLLYGDYHGRRVFFYSANQPFEKPLQTGDVLGYEVEGVVRFFWRFGEERIYYERLEGGNEWRLAFWFIHSLLPLYLTLEKQFVMLHCSAVEIDGCAVVFIAPYHAGKSTLAAALLERGHRLITDDILATWKQENKIYCTLSHPYYRPGRGKETLGKYTEHFLSRFTEIERIFLLDDRKQNNQTTTITPVSGLERFLVLKRHSILHTFKTLEKIHDRHILDLANTPFVSRLKRRWGMDEIQNICRTIEDHIGNHR